MYLSKEIKKLGFVLLPGCPTFFVNDPWYHQGQFISYVTGDFRRGSEASAENRFRCQKNKAQGAERFACEVLKNFGQIFSLSVLF
jgi:hypothetical protein